MSSVEDDTTNMETTLSTTSTTSTTSTPPVKVIGCVKFFDKKAGFGFISVLKTDVLPQFSEKDIFVHYSAIHIENQQYKYLVKGEYVEFAIMPVQKNGAQQGGNTEDKFNAIDITGIQGGKLMCETNYIAFEKPNLSDTTEINNLDIETHRRPYRGGGGGGANGTQYKPKPHVFQMQHQTYGPPPTTTKRQVSIKA